MLDKNHHKYEKCFPIKTIFNFVGKKVIEEMNKILTDLKRLLMKGYRDDEF
jgi:hypothetical protein